MESQATAESDSGHTASLWAMRIASLASTVPGWVLLVEASGACSRTYPGRALILVPYLHLFLLSFSKKSRNTSLAFATFGGIAGLFALAVVVFLPERPEDPPRAWLVITFLLAQLALIGTGIASYIHQREANAGWRNSTFGLVLAAVYLVSAPALTSPPLDYGFSRADAGSAHAFRTLSNLLHNHAENHNGSFVETLEALPTLEEFKQARAASIESATSLFIGSHRFEYVAGKPDANGKIASFVLTAEPRPSLSAEEKRCKRWWHTDQTEVIRSAVGRPATAADPASP